MRNEKVYLERINRFTENLKNRIYTKISDLKSSYIYDTINPIPYSDALKGDYKEINVGDEWGKLWGCGWFKFKGDIPKDFDDKEYGALLDISGEGCLFVDGSPYQGITNKIDWDHHAGKYYIKLNKLYPSGNSFELLIEAGANGLFGGGKDSKFSLVKADFVVKNREIYKLWLDLFALNNLMVRLDSRSPRRKKIMYALNRAINLFDGGKGVVESLKITADLLSKKSSESSMDIYSIGHAHIDMAWLWPIRETRRKAGRTFSTALRMMEEYPEYKFGASQPQLYQWVKEDYPKLFSDIQDRVKDGRWEVQGAYGLMLDIDRSVDGNFTTDLRLSTGKNVELINEIHNFTKTGSLDEDKGKIYYIKSSIDNSIESLNDQIASMEMRLENTRKLMEKKWLAMETSITKLKGQQSRANAMMG